MWLKCRNNSSSVNTHVPLQCTMTSKSSNNKSKNYHCAFCMYKSLFAKPFFSSRWNWKKSNTEKSQCQSLLSWPWEKKIYIVMHMCTFFCFLFGFTGRKNWSYDNPPSIKNKLFLKGSWSLKSSDSLFYLCILHCTLHCITIWTI